MPIFEYQCTECGHVTSFLEKADAAGKHACEACGSARTKKVFSTFSARSARPKGCPAGDSAAGSCRTCPDGTCPLA